MQGIIRDGMVQVVNDFTTLPEGKAVFVVVPDDDDLPPLAEQAVQHKAKMWIVNHVSMVATVGNGRLIKRDDRLMWEFGVYLASRTHYGKGPFGYIHVDSYSGEVLASEKVVQELIRDGSAFARSLSAITRLG